MKVALIAPAAVPAVQGGAENLWAGLMQSFNRLPGVTADFISPPSPETNLLEVLQGYQRFGDMDLKGYDRVVSTKYPAWACPHANHTVYLQHTLRGLYDTYPAHLGHWLSADQAKAMVKATAKATANSTAQAVGSLQDLRPAGLWLCKALEAASAPSWQLGARAQAVGWAESAAAAAAGAVVTSTATTARLAALLIGLLKALQVDGEHWAEAYPGPFARACVRLLDAVALAPSRIRSYQAISQTVAERADYFPPGVQVHVRHHPTALAVGDPLHPDLHPADSTRPAPGQALKRDILLAPSRLEPPKRMDMIIRGYAASGLSTPLWIVGTGPQQEELQALATQTPGVEMKGFLSQHELTQAYNRAQFVVFAPQQEDYGLITVEAFKAGAPVLTCLDAGGPTELVVHGQSGYLAEPSAEGLAKGFQHLAGLDAKAREAMGKQGQHWVHRNLSWLDLAQNLLSQPKSQGHYRSPLRLLVLNTFPIEPVNSGGRQRMLGLYKGLAQQARVELISLSTTDQHPVLRRHAPGFTELRLPAGKPMENLARYYEKQLGMSCFDITAALHPGLLAHAMPWLKAGLARANAVVLSHPYGYALLEQLSCEAPEFAEKLENLPLVYEAHNVETKLKQAMLAAAPSTALGRQFAHAVAALEHRLSRRAELVAACSAQDAQVFQGWRQPGQRPVLVVANGLDLQQVQHSSWLARLGQAQQRGYGLALFVGSSHTPNVNAARLIAQVASAMPGWQFVLLGGCGPALQRAGQPVLPANLHCLGLVSEQEKQLWLAEATVGLNPMASGSGTNLKIAEYAAWGLPVLATGLGVRGWNWQPGSDYLHVEASTASVSQGLEAALSFMQQGKAADHRLREQALQLGWPRIARQFGQALQSLV